ncbi:MAG: T9SS type A sorting domain-containing protein [Bacteroidota bacterium]
MGGVPIFGQTSAPFSDLNNQPADLYNSVTAEDGIIYFIGEVPSNKLIKVNWEGKITHQLTLPFQDSLYYNGQLLRQGDDYYLVGLRRLFPNSAGTNNREIWLSQRRSILQFDENLQIKKTFIFDIIPIGTGEVIGQSGTFVGTLFPSSLDISQDEIRALWSYAIFDTAAAVPSVIGQEQQYERINLQDSTAFVKQLNDVQMNLDGIYLQEDFYVYGDISDTIVNGAPFNSRPVALYDDTGKKKNLFFFDATGSGAFSDGALGTLHKGKIYSTYYGRSVNSTGCATDNTVIEIRDTAFNFINRVKLPDCGLFPYGKNSFAFTSTGEFYFTARDANGLYLYQFNDSLDVVCSGIINIPPREVPVSLKITPEDTLIVENIFAESQMKLYKFSCGTATAIAEIARPTISLYPNPTTGRIYVEGLDGPAYLKVYTAFGKLVSQTEIQDGMADLAQIANGMYLIELIDKRSQQVLSRERIIKINP